MASKRVLLAAYVEGDVPVVPVDGATLMEQIECAAMTYIKNDMSLDWDMKNRLPVFYRRMWNYMQAAIPLFNKPPTMLLRLRNYTEPQFSDVLYPVTAEPDGGTITVNSPAVNAALINSLLTHAAKSIFSSKIIQLKINGNIYFLLSYSIISVIL